MHHRYDKYMKDLQYWQQKIQDKRKQTDFRNFLIEVVSWSPLTYYRNNGYISIFPVSGRIGNIVSLEKFEEKRNDMCDTNLQNSESIFEELITLIQKTLLPSVRNYFQCENSEFSDTNSYSKDLYLTRCSTKSSKLLNCLVVKDT